METLIENLGLVNASFKTGPFIKFNYEYTHGNAGILSIKIPFNIARRNHCLDSHCILTVMIPQMMTRAICCKKSF